MDYGRIVNRSFEIAWRYKFLWLFGMFASGGAFNLEFEHLVDREQFDFSSMGDMESFFSPELFLSFALAIFLWVIILSILSIISNAALIDSVNRIERGGKFSFSIAFSSGLTYFWKFFLVAILLLVAGIGVFGITIFILVMMFMIHTAVGFLSLLFFIPIFFFLIFIFHTIGAHLKRVLVVRNCSISEAFSEAVFLLKNNFGKNLMVFLILIGINLAFGLMIGIIWLMVGIPIGLIIVSMGLSKMLAFAGAFLIGLPISFLLGGIIGVFSSSLYTLFYFELVEPKQVLPSEQVLPGDQPQPIDPTQPGGPTMPSSPDNPDQPNKPPETDEQNPPPPV